METKLLRLWISSLRAYKPKVEPEAGHFDSLIEWLESYIKKEKACRICDLAAATGDDGLCDGCRSAVILERARIP